MTKLSTFRILFNNPAAVYIGGQSVIGSVVLVLTGPMKMRQIYLDVSGKAKVKWRDRKYGEDNSNYYVAKESYMKNRVILLGSDNRAQSLPAGSYQYPFSFTLPINLPSSYEGGIGFVRYSVEAVIDKPWRINHNVCLAFTVVGNLDLNLEPSNWREPFEAEITQNVCGCCCIFGNVMAKLTIEKRLFVPGENVVINNIVIDNRSNGVINQTWISLRQVIEFRAKCAESLGAFRYKSRVVSNVIGEVRDGTPIPPNQLRVLNNSSIRIPQVIPSRMDGCNIINVAYFIELHSSIGLEISVGIVIGSVPLIGNFNCPTITAQPQRQPAPQFATTGASHYGSNIVASAPPPHGEYYSGHLSDFAIVESQVYNDTRRGDDDKFRTTQAAQ